MVVDPLGDTVLPALLSILHLCWCPFFVSVTEIAGMTTANVGFLYIINQIVKHVVKNRSDDNKIIWRHTGEDTMDDLTPAYLGARLARMRLQLGQSRREDITQRRLAHALDIKPQAYNSWEQGKALPRLDHLWRLARYYRVSLDRLCG